MIIWAPVFHFYQSPQLEPARAEGDSIKRYITAVVRTFERLAVAVDEVQVGGRPSHLPALTDAATDRLAHAHQLHEHLEAKG